MTKRKLAVQLFLVGGALIGLGGCAMSQSPVSGFIYTDVEYGTTATGQVTGTQKGQACASSILGIIATGDASVMAAARAGRISHISHVDHNNFSILGLYAKHCTIVYGKTGGGAKAAPTETAP